MGIAPLSVSVIIATYGSDEWRELAWSRAYSSTVDQGAHEVIVGHEPEGTLASVRNKLAAQATGDWLCFLDGDDELAPGYIHAMEDAVDSAVTWLGEESLDWDWLGAAGCGWARQGVVDREEADLRFCLFTPSVSYVMRGQAQPPKFWPEVDLRQSNWLVIGTLISREFFDALGGFREFPVYEDYDLFLRARKAGMSIFKVLTAVYRAHWRSDSRNKGVSREEATRTHWQIGRDSYPEDYGDDWLRQHLGNVPQPRRLSARSA